MNDEIVSKGPMPMPKKELDVISGFSECDDGIDC
jgi:hypothetical protein